MKNGRRVFRSLVILFAFVVSFSWLLRVAWINWNSPTFCESAHLLGENVLVSSRDESGASNVNAVSLSVEALRVEDDDALRLEHFEYCETMGQFEAEGRSAIILVTCSLANKSEETQTVNLSNYYLCTDAWFNAVDYYYLLEELGYGGVCVTVGGREEREIELPYLICESQFVDCDDMDKTLSSPMELVVSRYPKRSWIDLRNGNI